MNMKVNVKVYQKGDKNHQDSFWYDGEVALITYKNREILMIAAGDIRINKRGGEMVYDCKPRNSGLNFKLEKDKDLRKIGNNYDDKYYWENNNWFELLYRNKKAKEWTDFIGDVFYEYDEAIKTAKKSIIDDEWWNLTIK
jgi:hypothetical protein